MRFAGGVISKGSVNVPSSKSNIDAYSVTAVFAVPVASQFEIQISNKGGKSSLLLLDNLNK